MMSSELLKLVNILSSELLWIYFIIIFAVFYALVALLTWNIKKPLMFLGIPFILVGIILVILRFVATMFLPSENFTALLNSAVKPLFTSGIICIVVGIAMIVLYNILKNDKNKDKKAAK